MQVTISGDKPIGQIELRIVINFNVVTNGVVSNQEVPTQGQFSVQEVRKKEEATLSALYESLLAERDKDNRVSQKTIRDNHSYLNRFESWCRDRSSDQNQSCISQINRTGLLKEYAEYLRSQTKGSSASMCQKALAVINKLASACVKAGIISVRPECVSRSHINMLRPRTEKQRRVKAVPVVLSELKALLDVVDGCKWPKIGKVSPAVFWETCLLSHYVYGFRSQDWFASRTSEKFGLLWSGVVKDSKCPVIDDLHNDAGWVWYLVHKTAQKDEAAERPSDVLVPLSSRMRELIEKFRGIDPKRVFPMRNNAKSYSKEFSSLLKRAGLSDKEREAEGKSIIRLSLGQRDVASFRKGCSAMWAKHVSRSASSYMLHHAIAEERVSKMTTDCYLQDEDILRQITAGIETLPVWQIL